MSSGRGSYSFFDLTLCPQYKIGTSVLLLARLPDIGIPDPYNSLFDPFSVRYEAGDGSVRGGGFPRAAWDWTGLGHDQYWALFQFFSVNTASKSLYICTRVHAWNGLSGSDVWRNFAATMRLPEHYTQTKHAPQHIRAYTDFRVEFTYLVEQ